MKRRASVGYGTTFVFAGAGLFASVIALAATLYARSGRNPADAIDGAGAVALIYMFPLSMVAAFTFSDRLTESARRKLRIFLMANFVVSIGCTIAAIILLHSTANGRLGIPISFSITASICQISALIWLIRYSREGEA